MKVRTIALTIAVAMMLGVFAFAAPAKGQGTQTIQITDGPRVEGTGDTWAVVAWTTNAGGSSIVHYGTHQNSLTQTAESPYSGEKVHSGKVTHRVHIENLQPNTTYYFQVDSGQGSGTGTNSQSGILNFQTKAQGQSSAIPAGSMSGDNDENMKHAAVKITDGPRVEGTTSNSAVIAWTTNEASSSVIKYGTNPNSLTQTAQAGYADKEGANKQTHRVHINNLQPHTTYYFVVDSGQGEGTGTQAASSVSQFTTK
jgi:phosphodiesterase/alkaline phosphatase D-like protein